MGLSRKNYYQIADAMVDARVSHCWASPPRDHALINRYHNVVVNHLARALRGTNPGYDMTRFIAACQRDSL